MFGKEVLKFFQSAFSWSKFPTSGAPIIDKDGVGEEFDCRHRYKDGASGESKCVLRLGRSCINPLSPQDKCEVNRRGGDLCDFPEARTLPGYNE